MMKLTTVAVGTMLALSAYSGIASANAGKADFSAAITAKTPMVCGIEMTPPESTLTAVVYSLGKDGELGKATLGPTISGDLVIKMTGAKKCTLGNIQFVVNGTTAKLNGQDVLGALTKSGTGIYPAELAVSHVRAFGPDGEKVTATTANGAWTTDELENGFNMGKSGEQKNEAGGFITRMGFGSVLNGGDISYGNNHNYAPTLRMPALKQSNGLNSWHAGEANSMNFGVSVLLGAHPYNIATGKPDDTVVEAGEQLVSTATVTVTQL